MLRAADRYAYTGFGSTAYSYLFYLGESKYLWTWENAVGREPVSCDTPGPCPAEVYKCTNVRMYERTNLRIATDTRPTHNGARGDDQYDGVTELTDIAGVSGPNRPYNPGLGGRAWPGFSAFLIRYRVVSNDFPIGYTLQCTLGRRRDTRPPRYRQAVEAVGVTLP